MPNGIVVQTPVIAIRGDRSEEEPPPVKGDTAAAHPATVAQRAPHTKARSEGAGRTKVGGHHLVPLDGGGLVRCRRVVMKEGAADAAHLQPRREARVLHRAKARVDGRQLPKLRVEHSSIAVFQLRGERMLEPREHPAVTPDAGVARRDCKRARLRGGSPVNSSVT